MKTRLHLIAGPLIALASIVSATQESHAHQAPPQARMTVGPAMSAADLEAGRALYAENCARCHGSDGRGRTREAARLKVPPADLARAEQKGHSEGEVFWVISHGIKASEMPAFDDLTEAARWQITAHVKTLASGPSTSAQASSSAEKPVTIRFRATVAGKPFSCASAYEGLGVNRNTVSPLDFRFFIHDLRLVRADGTDEPIRLSKDARWQDGDVALLDFEDRTGTCANGTPDKREVVTGTVRAGAYVGLRLVLGVPFSRNHGEPVRQAPPLDLTQMFWVWNAGYKFARIDMKADGRNFFIHLGSTGCTPSDNMLTAPTSCESPNRVDVRLAEFDPETDVVEADLARLLEGADLITNQPKTAAGCMSGPDDLDCAPLFRNFGLPFAGKPAVPQTFLRRAPRTEPFAWDLPQGFPVPRVPADNPMNTAKVELGRFLFYDTRMSVTGRFSCASCHEQSKAFTDGKAQGVGATGQVHPRGSMALTNVAYSPVLTWANPNVRSLETQALVPMFGEEPVELGLAGKERELVARYKADQEFVRRFREAFSEDTDPVSLTNITRALAAFERTLISGRSPYDAYRFGLDPKAITDEAKRGEALFFSERLECFHCHGGFNFTQTVDYASRVEPEIEFHNTGLYNVGGHGDYPAPNTGVHAVSGRREDMGRFKAPTLRNIAVTAPYMHDGSIATLEEAIDHYQSGGRAIRSGPFAGDGSQNPLKSGFVKSFTLDAAERASLIAFLESLTDRSYLENPRLGNPWAGARTAAR
jgi:cytochrome c peroxidase